MVDEPVQPKPDPADEKDGFSFWGFMTLFGGGVTALLLVIFFVGFLLSLTSPTEATATRIGMLRDVFIILLALEFIIIIGALAMLIIQVSRLIAMLRDEIKPIVSDTRETVDTAKGTAQFVGQNVTRPMISLSAFLAGFAVFMRELGGIRRAVRKEKPTHSTEQADDEA